MGGSLGGVQVVSVSERAGVHSRVLAAGRAPAAPTQHAAHDAGDDKALLFSISRTVRPCSTGDHSRKYRYSSSTSFLSFKSLLSSIHIPISAEF